MTVLRFRVHRRPLLTVGLVVAVLVLWTLMFTPRAHAAWGGRIGYAVGGHTIGTMRPPGYGEQVVCIDSRNDLPSSATGGVSHRDPGIAYVITTYSQTTDPDLAGAVAYFVKKRLDSSWAAFEKAFSGLPKATQDSIMTHERRLEDEAAKLSAPFVVALTLRQTSAGAGVVEGVGVRGAGGGLMAGVGLSLVLSGGPVWDDNGTPTLALTSATSGRSLAWHASAAGEVSVSASAKNLPGDTVQIHPAPQPGEQRVVTHGAVSSALGTSNVVALGVRPSYSSQVDHPIAAVGEALSDVVSVKDALPGGPLRVTTTFYGPLTSCPEVPVATPPKDAPVFEAVTHDITIGADGKGTARFLSSLPVKAAGCYIGVESNATSGLTLAAAGTYGRPSETSLRFVLPTLATAVSNRSIAPGTEVSDAVTITGVTDFLRLVPKGSASLSIGLSGPVAVNGSSCPDATGFAKAAVVGVPQAVAVTADGTLTGVAPGRPAGAGCYSYGGDMRLLAPDGTVLATVNHAPGQASESFLVTAPVAPTSPPPAPKRAILSGAADLPPAEAAIGACLSGVGALFGLGGWAWVTRTRRRAR